MIFCIFKIEAERHMKLHDGIKRERGVLKEIDKFKCIIN